MARGVTPRKVQLDRWARAVVEKERQNWGKYSVRFSFKYFHANNGKLCGRGMKPDQIAPMFARLKEYEGLTWHQIVENHSHTHFRAIDFSISPDRECRRGFREQLEERMAHLTPYEIAVTNQIRLYGVIYIDSFYIVWCDHDHHVFPKES